MVHIINAIKRKQNKIKLLIPKPRHIPGVTLKKPHVFELFLANFDHLGGIVDPGVIVADFQQVWRGPAGAHPNIQDGLVLDGLPDLLKYQPSVARIFDIVELPLMSEKESAEFFTNLFAKSMITVAGEALSLMVEFSGGYPMLMHEIGDAVFWQNTDDSIDIKDAKSGITEAAKIVGRKYIGAQVSSIFRSETYASILLRMGKKVPIGATFKRQELLKENAPEKEQKNLDNFLSKIKKLGIMDDAEVRGEYRFVNPLYHLYVWYEARKTSKK